MFQKHLCLLVAAIGRMAMKIPHVPLQDDFQQKRRERKVWIDSGESRWNVEGVENRVIGDSSWVEGITICECKIVAFGAIIRASIP
jgi:hypothetical protein